MSINDEAVDAALEAAPLGRGLTRTDVFRMLRAAYPELDRELRELRKVAGLANGRDAKLRRIIARNITDWAETIDVDENFKPILDQHEAGRRYGAFEAADIALGKKKP